MAEITVRSSVERQMSRQPTSHLGQLASSTYSANAITSKAVMSEFGDVTLCFGVED
jgi:hypothetical protein